MAYKVENVLDASGAVNLEMKLEKTVL